MADAPQVGPEHYQSATYERRERMLGYWHQADEILRRKPENVLEVGIGNGFLHRYLRARAVNIHTLDFDGRLEPDTVGSVLELPFADKSFDAACCFETLEHLPWKDFPKALAELTRVARRWVLLSLPDVSPYMRLTFDLGPFHVRRLHTLPSLRPRPHAFDGEHYWEIGKLGYPIRRVKEEIDRAGLDIESDFRVAELPYFHFLSCRVRR